MRTGRARGTDPGLEPVGTIRATGPLWLWSEGQGSWHFLTIAAAQAAEIRLQGLASRRGFGSVRVEARIGGVRWRTSVFPVKRTGEYLLPVKAEVRRRAGVAAGDEISVVLELI